MVGLSDQVNNAAKQTKPINGNPLPGYHIYSRSERHRNRVLPAHLTYRPEPQSLPPPSPPRQYANERSRLLHEGLRNNGHFVLNKTINDLADERRAEEVRAQKALEAEHAWHAERERKKQAEKLGATDPSVNSVGAKLQIDFQRSALLQRQLHLFQRTEPEQPTSETEQSSEPEPEQRTEADQQTRAEEQVGTEQQTETEQEVETDQPHQRAPSFDPEFDEDRGVFNNPLAGLNGADPFADFDGDHTHLHGEIDYGEERGNLSDSDSDEKDEDNDSSSEEGSDQESEEDSSSEDESDRNNRFASFDGDHTHLHTPFVAYEDFEIYEDSTAGSEPEDDNSIEIELGRLPDYLQGLGLDDDQVQIFEDPEDEIMDSIDEILAAAHATGYPHEDEDEDMGDDVDLDYEDGDDIGDEDEHDDMDMIPSAPFNPIAMGLKEIGGLAHFRVSSFKPGNGVDELKNDDTERYWQSDGVQPHRLTMAFVKEVEIRALRFYVDYVQDESYTPTKIVWKAGTSENNLFKFAESELVNPSGWVDVPITGAGGGEDGNSLMAFVVRMEVAENHQNGKDTHIRGIKVYGFDDQLRAAGPTTGGILKEGGEGVVGFKVDETKNAEENEKALMAHLRNKGFERSMGAGDPSGTASSLDFIEDPVLR